MFSSKEIQKMELESTKEMYDALTEMIRHEKEEFKTATTEDERNVIEAKLKSYAKTLNEMKSCEDHSYMCDKLKIEQEKLKAASEEGEKSRKHDKKKIIGSWIFNAITTVVVIESTRKNMIVCEGWEKEHFAATTAAKKALEACCDLLGTFSKFAIKIGIK